MHAKTYPKIQKEELSLNRKCTRFTATTSQTLNHQNALIYLKLRQDGCKKNLAKYFSSKDYCKVDTTKEKDGPIGFRTLRLKKNDRPTQNGWVHSDPQWDLGFKHCTTPDEFLHNDVQSKYFEKHFTKHEEKIKENYKTQIQSLKKYFDEINAKCSFKHLTNKELYNKLRKENNEMKSGRKWRNLELLKTEGSGQWIDDEALLSPLSPLSPLSFVSDLGLVNKPLHSPKFGDASSRSTFTKNVSYDTAGIVSSPVSVSHRNSQQDEKSKILKPAIRLSTVASSSETKSLKSHDYIDIPEERNKNLLGFDLPKIATPALRITTIDLDSASQTSSNVSDDSDSEINLQKEDLIHFQKAYEELETHTQMLYDMTNSTLEKPHEAYLTKKEKKLISKGPDSNTNLDGQKKIITKNDELADDFNKISYFFYKNELHKVDIDSRIERERKAIKKMQQRKQKLEEEKNIFESIVRDQAQKDFLDMNNFNTENLELLKSKKLEIRNSLTKKAGLQSFTDTINMATQSATLPKHSGFLTTVRKSVPTFNGVTSLQVSRRGSSPKSVISQTDTAHSGSNGNKTRTHKSIFVNKKDPSSGKLTQAILNHRNKSVTFVSPVNNNP